MGTKSPSQKVEHTARSAALQVVDELLRHGHSLTELIPASMPHIPPRDRALFQELCYGTLRWLPKLEALLALLLEKPLKRSQHQIESLLLLGLYQLAYLRTPDHAVVSASVDLCQRLNKGWARGLVNALLRRFLREREALLRQIEQDEVASSAHPAWLLERIKTDWPQQWPEIVAANNQRPPMALRVNLTRQSRQDYLDELTRQGIAAEPLAHIDSGITLQRPLGVEELPGFYEGRVSVQDGAAQLAATLLSPERGDRVLDACAAPGGKSLHLLEYNDTIELTAVERDPKRLALVEENLSRVGYSAHLVAADAADPASWWDRRPYDRILVDAPCSATGVIRRHPDIKRLRRADDIDRLAQEQQRILSELWPLLRPGGRLLYATCSILQQEGPYQVAKFVSEREDCTVVRLPQAWGVEKEVGRQILPGQDGMDGFYYAALDKQG